MIDKHNKTCDSISKSTFFLALFIALVTAMLSASLNADTYDQYLYEIDDLKKAQVVKVENSRVGIKCINKNQSQNKRKYAGNNATVQVQHDVRIYPDNVTYRRELPRIKF